jgi:hypothetical protein
MKVMDIFMRQLMKKSLAYPSGPGVVFHWDNHPVHTAFIVQDWPIAQSLQVLCHPPYSSEFTPEDFLFRRMKDELAGISLHVNTLKKREEVMGRIKCRRIRHHLPVVV